MQCGRIEKDGMTGYSDAIYLVRVWDAALLFGHKYLTFRQSTLKSTNKPGTIVDYKSILSIVEQRFSLKIEPWQPQSERYYGGIRLQRKHRCLRLCKLLEQRNS
jgi:hypothetical protein